MSDWDDEKALETRNESEEEAGAPPEPISRALLFAFFSVLFLTIVSQALALYNAGTLSDLLGKSLTEEATLRDLTLALMDLEAGSRALASRMRGNEEATTTYTIAVSRASDILARKEPLAPEWERARETLTAALEDLRARDQLWRRMKEDAAARRPLKAVTETRVLVEAQEELRSAAAGSRSRLELLHKAIQRQSRILDRSLLFIATAMVLTGILLAFLWKRVIALH
ncbi:MAG: hypothetical protein D6679_04660 [Candidatus Hydrogenedentota bacterium]|nr:MAG: hypothetical protein D6679_04660 [Candidatus Hydrogenedentota bacterium]